MLLAVHAFDAASVARIRLAFEEVARRYDAMGRRVRKDVVAYVVPMPIMGATTTGGHVHQLYISRQAAASPDLDALIAHEMAHMMLAESVHPSHDARLWQRFLDGLEKRTRMTVPHREALRTAMNHIQDIYADDLAMAAGVRDRARDFFAGWIEGNARRAARDPWRATEQAVSNAFALGNLARRGLLAAEDPLVKANDGLAERIGRDRFERMVTFYRSLPVDPTQAAHTADLEAVTRLVLEAGREAALVPVRGAGAP